MKQSLTQFIVGKTLILGLSSFLIQLVFCFPLAKAQEYHRYRLPQGTRLTVSGQTYQGFNLGEYQELLRIDNDLRACILERDGHQTVVETLTNTITSLRAVIALDDQRLSVLRQERDRLHGMWLEENRRRLEAESRPDFSWIPWTITAVLAVVTVTLIVVIGVQ